MIRFCRNLISNILHNRIHSPFRGLRCLHRRTVRHRTVLYIQGEISCSKRSRLSTLSDLSDPIIQSFILLTYSLRLSEISIFKGFLRSLKKTREKWSLKYQLYQCNLILLPDLLVPRLLHQGPRQRPAFASDLWSSFRETRSRTGYSTLRTASLWWQGDALRVNDHELILLSYFVVVLTLFQF